MQLRSDERGVTVQIGTVLLFAVLILLLSTYQATVVPQQNEQVEFNHNQRVQGQLQDLRDELLRTAATGSGGSASVALGTQYPVRALFVNPAPPSGTLETTPPANLTIENATATGETGDYWTGAERNFSTRGMVYDPLYHVYSNAPTTRYESGVLFNRFESADRIVAGQQLVSGNRITMVALNGSLSESSSGTVSVDVRAVSAATRSVTVRNETANLSLVVPTTLSAEKWTDLLSEELNRTEGDDRRVLAVESVADREAVRVVLEPGVYELRLAKVGVGRDVTGVEPHYVTDVRGDHASVAEGTTQKLVVEVRDRYNNPVSGARVNLSLVEGRPNSDELVALGRSGQTLTGLVTDAQGRVEVRYSAGSFDGRNRDVTVRASIAEVPETDANAGFDPNATENLTFDLQVYSVGGNGVGGGGGGGDGSDPPTVQNFTVTDRSVPCDENPGGNCRGQTDVAKFDVAWNVTDDDGDFDSVTVFVNKSGATERTYSGATGAKTYKENGAYGDDYTITLLVRDGEGNRVCERVTDTANGDDTDQSRSSC